eukprot:m.119815 g.119815  ORF g.119815 m.119815 type:complete len:432 (+) comp23198_c0_seq1:161-1456(+)
MVGLLLLCFLNCALALDNGLGHTPPMGFSSWNYFLLDVNETVIREVASKMVSLGLRDLGFEYVNIDAGYLEHERSSSGQLVVNQQKFPGGLKNLSDWLHSQGLKMGVYTDLGNRSCGIGPGSYGHYEQDAQTFADWGADYLKVDYCGGNIFGYGQEEYNAFAQLRDALNKTGRPIYYSICPQTIAPDVGTAKPYAGSRIYSPPLNWTREEHRALSNSWLVEYRNNVDFWGPGDHCIDAGSPCGMVTNIDAVVQMTKPDFAGSGGWNDADMLQVCNFGHVNPGMTLEEYRSHYSVWAVMGSPLILSADLRTLADLHPDCLDMIKNPEIIAVNQNPSPSGRLAFTAGGNTSATITQQIFVRGLDQQQSTFAVVLLNRGSVSTTMTLEWSYLAVPSSTSFQVRDLWQHRNEGNVTGKYSAQVGPHGVVVLKLVR